MCYAILALIGAIYVSMVVWMVRHFAGTWHLRLLLPLGVCIGLVTSGMAIIAFLAWNIVGC